MIREISFQCGLATSLESPKVMHFYFLNTHRCSERLSLVSPCNLCYSAAAPVSSLHNSITRGWQDGIKTEKKARAFTWEYYESGHNSPLKSQINTISVTNFTVLWLCCLWSNKAVFFAHPSVLAAHSDWWQYYAIMFYFLLCS